MVKLYIHKSIEGNTLEKCAKFLDRFIQDARGTTGYGYRTKGGKSSTAFFKRSRFGLKLDNIDGSLVFRRMSTHKKIFAIIPISLIESYDGGEINLNQCICAQHLAGTHVKLKEPFDETKYFLYFEGIL